MKKIKIGLAAFGMSGQIFHAPFISTNMNFELTAIVERSKDLSKVRYPQVHIMRSLEELLASDVEIVVINTPDSTHYPFARQALKAGKNVIIEKPFCTTTEEGKELITLAKQKGLMLSVFQNRRWDSDFLTIKEIIDYELLGRLVEFESTFPRYRNYIKQNTWKETGEQGGGLIYNLGSHAAVATGYIKIPEDGIYYISSDNEEVWIDGKMLINNSGEVKRFSRHVGNSNDHLIICVEIFRIQFF